MKQQKPNSQAKITIIVATFVLVGLILYDLTRAGTPPQKVLSQLVCLGTPVPVIVLLAVLKLRWSKWQDKKRSRQ